jgi:catechol-2,3-dioxygenase
MSALRGLYAINCSQPELNDMRRILAHTAAKGINVLGLSQGAAESAIASELPLHGRVHVIT